MKKLIAEVNDKDEIIGYSEKQEVHTIGLLHRAFSIFIFNPKGQLLLHRRAFNKYHSPGLWTNTCCSHLSKGTKMEEAVNLRLMEEMGFSVPLKHLTTFRYRVEFDNGLIENEIDHIYVGYYDQEPNPHSDEVADYKWMDLPSIKQKIEKNPKEFTYWFAYVIKNHYQELQSVSQWVNV